MSTEEKALAEPFVVCHYVCSMPCSLSFCLVNHMDIASANKQHAYLCLVEIDDKFGN